MSEKVTYEEIMNRIKGNIDYIAHVSYKNGYDDGAKSVKNWDEEEKNLRIKEAYEKGLSDAWECVRRLEAILYDGKWFEFSNLSYHELINAFLPIEVIAILEAYDEEQEGQGKIRVGDEVESYLSRKYIIYKLSDDGKTACGLDLTDYPVRENVFTVSKAKKTGRHFDEIESLMQKMKGEE